MLRTIVLRPPLYIALVLAAAASVCVAQGASPVPRNWRKIADLPPGTPVLVHERGPHPVTPCLLEWIDNTAIACNTYDDLGHTRRVIFPAANVKSVQRGSDRPENAHSNTGVYVGMAVGGLVGGALLSGGGVKTGFVGAALGAGVGGGFALSSSDSYHGRSGTRWVVPLRMPSRRATRP